MPSLNNVLNAEGLLALEKRGNVIECEGEFTIAGLAGGMASGAPSVSFLIPLPDGRTVFAQTSLKLFLTAADAFKARYGDPRT